MAHMNIEIPADHRPHLLEDCQRVTILARTLIRPEGLLGIERMSIRYTITKGIPQEVEISLCYCDPDETPKLHAQREQQLQRLTLNAKGGQEFGSCFPYVVEIQFRLQRQTAALPEPYDCRPPSSPDRVTTNDYYD